MVGGGDRAARNVTAPICLVGFGRVLSRFSVIRTFLSLALSHALPERTAQNMYECCQASIYRLDSATKSAAATQLARRSAVAERSNLRLNDIPRFINLLSHGNEGMIVQYIVTGSRHR